MRSPVQVGDREPFQRICIREERLIPATTDLKKGDLVVFNGLWEEIDLLIVRSSIPPGSVGVVLRVEEDKPCCWVLVGNIVEMAHAAYLDKICGAQDERSQCG